MLLKCKRINFELPRYNTKNMYKIAYSTGEEKHILNNCFQDSRIYVTGKDTDLNAKDCQSDSIPQFILNKFSSGTTTKTIVHSTLHNDV